MAYESERWRCDPGARGIMCNSCVHYHRHLTCDAFPDGVPRELIYRGEHDTPYPGDNGIRYEKKEEEKIEKGVRPWWMTDHFLDVLRQRIRDCSNPYTDEEMAAIKRSDPKYGSKRWRAANARATLIKYGIPLEDDESGD